MQPLVSWDQGIEGRWLHEDDETEMDAEWPVSGTMRSGAIFGYLGMDVTTDAHLQLELLGTPRSGQRGVVHDSVRYGVHNSRLEVQVEILARAAEEPAP